jgi:TetR/AcrR family fatty acid metabolism transcriptional regulator
LRLNKTGETKLEKSLNDAMVGDIALGTVPMQKRGFEARERLFEAAMREFEARGVAGSRVENIVSEVNTSWGSFFRYFPRKEDVLLYAATKHFREHMQPAYEAGINDPAQSTLDVARTLFSEMTRPRYAPRIHAAMLDETVRHPVRFAAILGEGDLPLIRMFAGVVEEGQRRGEVRADADPFEAAIVVGAGVMFSTTRVLDAVADGHLPATEIEAVARRSLDLIWVGLGTG